MLAKIGVPDIDALFADVLEEARLDGPIRDLPNHASEMAVDAAFRKMARKNSAAADMPFFWDAVPIATMFRRASTT